MGPPAASRAGVEHEFLATHNLPLNINDSRLQPFCSKLAATRQEAKRVARETPVAQEGNLKRQMIAIYVRRM